MRTRHLGSLCVAVLVAGLAACDDASDPTTVPQHPQFAAASVKAQTTRHLITFKSSMPSTFEARVKALGGKVSLKDDALGFAAVSGLDDQSARAWSATVSPRTPRSSR